MSRVKQLYLETFGCQMNVSDSDKIVSLLKSVGYELTGEPINADLIILNTCSIRAKAEEKVYNHLANFSGLKKKRPGMLLGVGGCVAQQEGERLLEKVSSVDIVFGTHNLHRLPEIVIAAESGRRLSETDFIDSETRIALFPSDDRVGGISRFVTVMQGCDNFCSYCIVPYVRGREVSRRSIDILQEIERLSATGVKEVTLLGQNVNSYGLKTPGEPDFAGLLRQVAKIEGIERIRFTTSHPKDISPPLIACFAELPKLCGHIHLPAQSGSDSVLERMNRGYTRNKYLQIVAALRDARPDIQITSDIIVGFPGESEDDLQATLSLLEEVGYADIFSFIYSVRPETKAAQFTDALSYEEKRERLERVMEMQRKITSRNNKRFAKTRQAILVEGVSKRGNQLFGRTTGNRIVNFAGDPAIVGNMVMVDIVKSYQNSLLGVIVND